MNKIISVVGPTASGKTSFALKLAKKYLKDLNSKYTGIDLISVDSRQVYKGIETLTGADIPKGFEEKNDTEFQSKYHYKYFENKDQTVALHGVSIINISDDWSVAHFKNFAVNIIKKAWKKKRLPILVGGTGLYHKYLFLKDDNLYIPPNEKLRLKAQKMSLVNLQKWLEEIDKQSFEKMNNSDRNNHRRLTRAIEKKLGKPLFYEIKNLDDEYENIIYGMQLKLRELEDKIAKRVLQRFESGVLKEIEKINEVCKMKDSPVCSTLGLVDLNRYLDEEISKKQCLRDWSLHEYQYAKRQLTWFSKQQNIIWLDVVEKTKYT